MTERVLSLVEQRESSHLGAKLMKVIPYEYRDNFYNVLKEHTKVEDLPEPYRTYMSNPFQSYMKE